MTTVATSVVAEKFRERYAREGDALLGDADRLRALLIDDCLGKHRAEIFALYAALEQGAVAELRTKSATPVEVRAHRAIQRVRAAYPVDETVAAWAIRCWMDVLETRSPPNPEPQKPEPEKPEAPPDQKQPPRPQSQPQAQTRPDAGPGQRTRPDAPFVPGPKRKLGRPFVVKAGLVAVVLIVGIIAAIGPAKSALAQQDYRAGSAALRANDFANARALFTKAREMDPGLAVAWRDEGVADFDLNNSKAAVAPLYRAVTLDSHDELAFFWYGRVLLTNGSYRGALEPLMRATQLNDGDDGAWDNLATAQIKLGQYEPAIVILKKVVGREPRRAYAWDELCAGYGLDAIGKNRIDDSNAFNACRSSYNLTAKNYNASYYLGTLYDMDGRYQDIRNAASWLKFATGMPDNAETAELAWRSYGHAENQLGDYNEALVAARKASALNPSDFYAWYNRGFNAQALTLNSEALDAFNHALAINPSDRNAQLHAQQIRAALNIRPASGALFFPPSGIFFPRNRNHRIL